MRFPCVHAPAATPVQQLGVFLAHLTPRCQPSPLPLSGIDLFEACSAFTRVAACTFALSPIRDTLIEGFSHFVTSMPTPVASGWSESPGGPCTHWKAPSCHGARGKRSLVSFGPQAHGRQRSRNAGHDFCVAPAIHKRDPTWHRGRQPSGECRSKARGMPAE